MTMASGRFALFCIQHGRVVPPRPTRPDRPRQLGSQFRNGDRSKQNFKDERRTQPTLRPVLVLATHTHWVPNSSSTSTRNSSGTLKTTRPLAIGSALTSAYDFIMHCAIGDAFACGNNAKNAIVPTRTLRMFILPDGRVFCDHHVRTQPVNARTVLKYAPGIRTRTAASFFHCCFGGRPDRVGAGLRHSRDRSLLAVICRVDRRRILLDKRRGPVVLKTPNRI